MTAGLALFHRVAGQPMIVLGTGPVAEARKRLVERAGGVVTDDPEAPARFAFVVLDEPEAMAARLRARGLLINCADRPELCDFTMPALVERGPVALAVGTGGASAGLAKALRLRLEALLPAALGDLARGLLAARPAMRARWPDAGERRRALDSALATGGPLDPFDPAAAARISAWLAGNSDGAPGGVIELVLASADPDDLTLRQARLLGSADVVAHGREMPAAILARARADAARVVLAPGAAPPPATPGALVLVLRFAGAITGI